MTPGFLRFPVVLCALLVFQFIVPNAYYGPPSTAEAAPLVNLKVNFQPQEITAPDGFFRDSGHIYGNRDGLNYGWNEDISDRTIARNAEADTRKNTLISMEPGHIWEVELENGAYDVAVTVGDAVYGSTNTVIVEGIHFFNSLPVPAGQHETSEMTVSVNDGKLTVTNDGFAASALSSIEISYRLSAQPTPSAEPTPIAAPTASPSATAVPTEAPAPTPLPSPTPSGTPPTPAPTSTAAPSVAPPAVPTATPAASTAPSATPASSPSATPTATPSPVPTPAIPVFSPAPSPIAQPLMSLYSSVSDAVYIGWPAEARNRTGDKVLLSGNMGNEHQAPPYIRVEGLQGEIARYMNAEIAAIQQEIAKYEEIAADCGGCDMNGISQAIADSGQVPAVVKTGHLNLESDAVFGSPDRPVVMVVDGMNTNRKLTVQVYGILISRTHINGNQQLDIDVRAPSVSSVGGHLWVNGHIHLNNDSSVKVADSFYAGQLTYNNGQLEIEARRVLVENQMHINTRVEMNVREEMIVGSLISNNQTAHLNIAGRDFFVRDDVHVNNHLAIRTGGRFAVGGNITANQRPIVQTGFGESGATLLKFRHNGLVAEYFSEPDWSGTTYTTIDGTVSLQNHVTLPVPGITNGDYSVRWTGQVEPEYSEIYRFIVDTHGPVALWVDGQLLVHAAYNGGNQEEASIALEAGRRYDIRMEYAYVSGSARAMLSWQSDSRAKEIIPPSHLYPFAVPGQIVTEATATSLALEWGPVFNADAYDVEVDGVIVGIGGEPEFLHADLQPGTARTYRIRAVIGELTGEWSPPVTAWTLPDIPDNIALSSTSDTIRMEWDRVPGATGYDVEANDTVIDNGDVNVYEMKNLSPNVQKTFRVRAKNASGPGSWSALQVKSTRVAVPANLTGEASDSAVKLTWDAVPGAQSYDLEADGQIVSDLPAPSYVNAPLDSNSMHTYRVRAKNEHGEGGWSSAIQVVTLPRVPANFRLQSAETAITLSWDAVPGAVGYELEADGQIVDVGLQLHYNHINLAPDTSHTYRVRAKNPHVSGEWTDLLEGATLVGVPGNLRAVSSSAEISVAWDPVAGSLGYELEVDGVIMDMGLSTAFVHSGLAPNSEHTYRVRSRNKAGTGEWSAAVTSATRLGQPRISVTELDVDSIALSWEPVAGATGYDLLVDGQLIDNGESTSYTHGGLEPYSWHVYRVRARNADVFGDWSEAVARSTLLGTPVITDVRSTSDSILVEWSKVAGATYYEIEVDGTVIRIEGQARYEHEGLEPNSTHIYRVRAGNDTVSGHWSGAEQGLWSVEAEAETAPDVPAGLKAEATTHSITLSWEPVSEAYSYELEIDGEVLSGISAAGYTHGDLESNEMHIYRVRAVGDGGPSEWSDYVKERTVPELTFQAGRDTQFNFIVVVPRKEGINERKITVQYNPDEVELLDLSAITPETEQQPGRIQGTAFTVDEFVPGQIVYTVQDAEQTAVNSIKFISKTSEYATITYTIR